MGQHGATSNNNAITNMSLASHQIATNNKLDTSWHQVGFACLMSTCVACSPFWSVWPFFIGYCSVSPAMIFVWSVCPWSVLNCWPIRHSPCIAFLVG